MKCDCCGKEFYTGFSNMRYQFCSEQCLINEFGYTEVKGVVTNWFEQLVTHVVIDEEEKQVNDLSWLCYTEEEEEEERRREEEEEEERRRWEDEEQERLAEGSCWW